MHAAHQPVSISRENEAARLSGLDVLRGIAALWVLHYHTIKVVLDGHNFGSRGYLAVDFFFMLSGYVMARSYEDKFRQGYGLKSFFTARYRRVWPTMAIGGLISAPMLMCGGLSFTGGGKWSWWLGALSFPLYAVHHPILHWVKGLHFGVATGNLAGPRRCRLSCIQAARKCMGQQNGTRQRALSGSSTSLATVW